jgi:protein import protein ZIM17
MQIFSDDRITIQDILSAKGESISQSTDDLIFDEIPERLKDLIGHHAKDAPDQASDKASNNDQDSTKFLTDEK